MLGKNTHSGVFKSPNPDCDVCLLKCIKKENRFCSIEKNLTKLHDTLYQLHIVNNSFLFKRVRIY